MGAQTSPMAQLFTELLGALTVDDDIIKDTLKATEPAPPSGQVQMRDVDLRLTIRGDQPFYPIELSGKAKSGIFLLEGFNNRGKTTALITASILLGTDWEDNNFQAFLQHEERYIDAGKRFQIEFEDGSRSATLTVEGGHTSTRVTIDAGRATVSLGTETKDFNITADGWHPYQDYIREHVQCEFIPQRRDYLQQVYKEVSDEFTRRWKQVRDYLLEKSGSSAAGADDQATRSYEEELGRRQNAYKLAELDLEKSLEICTLLQRIEEAEHADPDRSHAIVSRSTLEHLISAIEESNTQIQEDSPLLDEEEADYATQTDLHNIAYPALERLKNSLDSRLDQLHSHELKRRIVTTLASRTIQAWQDFQTRYTFSDSSLYSDLHATLSRKVGAGDSAEQTFPFHDEVFNRDVSTIEDYKDLVSEHLEWAREFNYVVGPALNRFISEVSGCSTIAGLNLDMLADQLVLKKAAIDSSRRTLSALKGERDSKVAELRTLVEADVREDVDSIIDLARNRAREFGHEVTNWDIGGENIDDLVERAGYSPEIFWAGGGPTATLAQRSQDLAQKTTSVEEARITLRRAEVALQQHAEERARKSELKYARAYAILEYSEPMILNYVQASFNAQATEFGELLAWQQPLLIEDPVDILTPLSRDLARHVAARCGSYYELEETGLWKSWPIKSVNLQDGVLDVDHNGHIMKVHVMSQLGTGVSAAMTVRSLASRSRSPKQLTVLLVDEWGDVEKTSLAQLVYSEIASLPDSVIAVFTLPSGSLIAQLVDGSLEA